jgi:NAD(P)H-hydrate epimerase
MVPRVGVDVTAIERVEAAYRRHRGRFLRKFLTEREITYCADRPERWAGRWAAKEAIGKAMPSGVSRPRMVDVEILPQDDGRPHVQVAPGTTLSGSTVDVSIAHDGHFAIAVAAIPEADVATAFPDRPEGVRLPDRPADGHKGTFGTVVVMAGSRGFTGAAYLASAAAARTGAGLVRLLVADSIYPILAEKSTEVMVHPVPEVAPGVVGDRSSAAVLALFAGCDAAVIGPGLGRDPSTRRLLEALLPQVTIPVVLDADGLNLVSEIPGLLARLPADLILTPHPGEFSRLSGLKTADVQADRPGVARRFAKSWRKVVVLKGAETVIADPDGRLSVNPVATPALASGGTGDVLAGMIGALRGQGLPAFEAAVTGVYIHGLAGQWLERDIGRSGVLASDLLPEIPRVMERLRASQK